MPDRGHTPGEQEREWTIRKEMGPHTHSYQSFMVTITGPDTPPEGVRVVPKADDVTDNYMVAVSRLKAERDEFKAQLDEAREALKGIARLAGTTWQEADPAENMLYEVFGDLAGMAETALARLSPPTE